MGCLASCSGAPNCAPSPGTGPLAAAVGGCLPGNLGAGGALNLTCGGGEGGARLCALGGVSGRFTPLLGPTLRVELQPLALALGVRVVLVAAVGGWPSTQRDPQLPGRVRSVGALDLAFPLGKTTRADFVAGAVDESRPAGAGRLTLTCSASYTLSGLKAARPEYTARADLSGGGDALRS